MPLLLYECGMTVGLLRIRFRLPSRSLKEKRAIIRPVVERARNRFNASVAEVEDMDSAEFATIAVACVANDSRFVQSELDEIAHALTDARLDLEVLDIATELIDA